jgi:hypothetical protein
MTLGVTRSAQTGSNSDRCLRSVWVHCRGDFVMCHGSRASRSCSVQVIASVRGWRCGLFDVTEVCEPIDSASEPPTGVLSRSDAFIICLSELGPRSRASVFRAFTLSKPSPDRVVDEGSSLEGGSLPRQLKTQYGRKRNAVAFSPGRLAARPNRYQIGKGRADGEIPLHHNPDTWNIQPHAKCVRCYHNAYW